MRNVDNEIIKVKSSMSVAEWIGPVTMSEVEWEVEWGAEWIGPVPMSAVWR